MSFDLEPFRVAYPCPKCGGCVSLFEANVTCRPSVWACENPACDFEEEAK